MLVGRFNYNHTAPVSGYIPDRNRLADYNPFMSFQQWIENKTNYWTDEKGFPLFRTVAGIASNFR